MLLALPPTVGMGMHAAQQQAAKPSPNASKTMRHMAGLRLLACSHILQNGMAYVFTASSPEKADSQAPGLLLMR